MLLKAADRVVPAAQATTFHVLLTPLITYAEVDQASTLTAVWRLIHFWAQLLNE